MMGVREFQRVAEVSPEASGIGDVLSLSVT